VGELVSPLDSDRPVMALDIDGVLQLLVNNTRDLQPGYIMQPKPQHWLAYNPEHGKWLNQVLEQADIFYISDWQAKSHGQIGKVLGLPEFDWINSYRFDDCVRHESRALAITALFENRPLAWLDDEINDYDLAWAERRSLQTPTLMIKPNRRIGLTSSDMAKVNSWIGELIINDL
jgi:hypothetical protein